MAAQRPRARAAALYAVTMTVLYLLAAPLGAGWRASSRPRAADGGNADDGRRCRAVLGISAHYHDAAAALVVDGAIVAAMQEERFSRIKNDPGLPRAGRARLPGAGRARRAGTSTRVVFYENPYAKLERVLVSTLRAFPRSWRQFPRALGAQLGAKIWVLDEHRRAARRRRATSDLRRAPPSHAASAFFPARSRAPPC